MWRVICYDGSHMTHIQFSTPQLILASGSPRRYELLSTLQVPFEVVVSDAEETDTLPDADTLRVLPVVDVDLQRQLYLLMEVRVERLDCELESFLAMLPVNPLGPTGQ